MKVILFGGSGFIGKHYRRHFASSADVEVLSYDLRPDEGTQFMDVRERIQIDEKFNSDDLIINLAAVHQTPGHENREYFETNIRGAENINQFASETGITNILFTSSIAPYGASEEEKFENTLPTPNTAYGISKLVAEHIHQTWAAAEKERKLLIIRPGVVFGKGENGNFTRLAKAINSGFFFYPGRRDTIKACIYVKELVMQSLRLFEEQQNEIEIFNFAYHPPLNLQQITTALAVRLNSRSPRIVIPASLLRIVATVLKMLVGGAAGIHPARVDKLVTSTNISGAKLSSTADTYFSFEEGLDDWFQDCERKGFY